MNEKIEIIKQIYKDSNMSIGSIKKLRKVLKDKDNKIKNVLDDLIKEYSKYEKESKMMLKSIDMEPEKESIIAKFMANSGIKKEASSDNSDSHIAGVLIEGISMGCISIEKKIDDYKSLIDEDTINFAKKYKNYQEEAIEKLKKYL